MAEAKAILIPLLNPNEPEARLVTLYVVDAQHIEAGDPVCLIENTKSAAEVVAETEGFVVGLRASPGELLRAGERLCWVAESADWEPPQEVEPDPEGRGPGIPEGLRITNPALALARRAGLDLSELPHAQLITERDVRSAIAGTSGLAEPEGPFNPRALVLYGGGGHGKSLIDLILAIGTYDLVGVIDDSLKPGGDVAGLAILGGSEKLAELAERGVRQAINAVGGIGDIGSRIRVFNTLGAAGFACPTVVHPRAYVEPSARLAGGVQVLPHSYVGSEASVGFGAIINTSAVVSHDCRVGDYANISPGALLAGGVSVGEGALVGMGVTVNLNVTIGPEARIGNSAVVKSDVPARGVVKAGGVWPEPVVHAV
ncbi:MAG TPA: NeuD/PglB/VioB family sugar acetyltransferase [Anaerolineales bacterium]|nr:NeuD/PglB/VioB family sugar acetyltransferase [Anaerolineales bacterium]